MKAFKEIFQGLNSAYGQTVLSDVYSENGKQKTRTITTKETDMRPTHGNF